MRETTTDSYHLFVGVDVAATSFTAAWVIAGKPPATPRTFPQTSEGFGAFQQALAGLSPTPAQVLVVVEATGSYWTTLAVTLHAAGYQVSVVNPAHVHHFARSLPPRGKQDTLDAALLARFALERQPAPWTPPPAVYHELRQRLVVRDGLLHMRVQANNQLHALDQWPVVVESVRAQLTSFLGDLDGRLATLDKEIATLLKTGEWAVSAALLLTIPGVGTLTTAWLLVSTLNFTLCDGPEALAAYAGLVPHPFQSGSSVYTLPAIGHTGNGRLRRAMYLAAFVAIRCNPLLRPFYQRLRAAGKPHRVACCAAARKLLHLTWAIVTKQQPFAAERAVASPTQIA